jgi:hypothetical protein
MMSLTKAFHYGVLVFEIDAAIERLHLIHGYTFTDTTSVHIDRLCDPTEHAQDIRCAFSRQGPFYIELIEATGNGIYSARHGEGIHHIGIWDDDVSANQAKLVEEHNVEIDAQVLDSGGRPFSWYAMPQDTLGIRYEFVDASLRPEIEAWIRVGRRDNRFSV